MNRDRYGGWTDLQFEATGYFRLERTDERDWLVTPDGNAFLSFGGNHVQPNIMHADYNRSHWEKTLGVDDLKGDAFDRAFQQKVVADLDRLGWNTLGCHSSQRYYAKPFAPYVRQHRFVDICHYMESTEEDFVDVFSESFVSHCDEMGAETAAALAHDPLLVGYSMTDCPVWTDEDAEAHEANIYGWKRPGLPTWPRVLRNLGAGAAGKAAYVETVKEIYGEIDAFNRTYATTFGSFEDLAKAEHWRPESDTGNKEERRDNLAFLNRVVDRCYEVEVAAIRKHDPNHMIFGDKLNGNTSDSIPDDLIRIAGRHFDLVFYQYYALWEDQVPLLDRFARLTGKPIFHGDSSCSVPHDKMPNPFGPHCANQEERAAHFREMLEGAFSRRDYVGWNWCGWMDAWESHQAGKQHSGVQDPFGAWHPIADEMKAFSDQIYTLAASVRR